MKKTIIGILTLVFLLTLFARIVSATPKLEIELDGQPGLSTSVPVTLDVYFDPLNSAAHFNLTKTYGSKVSMASYFEGMPAGYVFSFWVVNGFVRQDLTYDYQFVITENLALVAVYRPTVDEIVCFMDSNEKLITWQYSTTASPFTSAQVPTLEEFSKPGYVIAANPWGTGVDFNNITTDTFVMIHYEPVETPNTYTISVTNGTGSGSYAFDSIVSITADPAPEGFEFSYWEDEKGDLVSILPTYSFTAYRNASINAVYDTYTWEDMGYATLSDPLYLREGKTTFVGHFHIPEGSTLIEYGIHITNYRDIDVYHEASNLNPLTNEFVMSFDSLWGVYANIYVYYIDASYTESVSRLNEQSDTLLIPNHPMISEYGEGSSNNKWIEIYNPSLYDSIDLSNYQIQLFINGATSVGATLSLTGTLLPGDVYVIANASASPAILALADVTSSVTNFNGDDAIGIYDVNNTTIIDVVGVIGVDPGTSWECNEGATAEYTLIRDTGLFEPTSAWESMDWYVLAQDNISNLGYHENREPMGIGYDGSLSLMVGQTEQLVVIYDDPLDSIRGVTWTSDDESIATVSADGLVTAVSEGNVMIYATSTVNTDLYVGAGWTITAPTYYDVDATSSNTEHGTVSASPTSVLSEGSSIITITPAVGYYTDYITVNGVDTQLDGTNTFTINNITATQTVVVTFDPLNTISVSSNNETYGTVSSSVSNVMDGGSATLTFTPASGYRTDFLTINGTTTVQLDGASTYQLSSISTDQSVVVTFEESLVPTEQSIYTTGFESDEGFTNGSVYNNTTVKLDGAVGQQWGTYYGTASTTNPLYELMSMQMRWYASAPANLGYTFTNFTLLDATKVTFYAANTSSINVIVSYSIDDGVTYINPQTFTLTSTKTMYTYNISETGLDVRVKFQITYTTTPADKARLYIDDVTIYGMR